MPFPWINECGTILGSITNLSGSSPLKKYTSSARSHQLSIALQLEMKSGELLGASPRSQAVSSTGDMDQAEAGKGRMNQRSQLEKLASLTGIIFILYFSLLLLCRFFYLSLTISSLAQFSSSWLNCHQLSFQFQMSLFFTLLKSPLSLLSLLSSIPFQSSFFSYQLSSLTLPSCVLDPVCLLPISTLSPTPTTFSQFSSLC